MSFSHFGLDPRILTNLKKIGYTQPTPIQEMAIPKVMANHDTIGLAQTGTGKTAAFVLPLLHRLITKPEPARNRQAKVLILSPTRELAVQTMENIRRYGNGQPIRVAAIYGGVDEADQISALQRGVHFIVATPGRLLDLSKRFHMDFSRLDTLVLDEADRMLDMGFLPDIEALIAQLPHRRQTLMFSSTLSKDIESLARRFQHQPKLVQIGKRGNPADTVEQFVYEVPSHLRTKMLLELLKSPELSRVLVFTRMRDGANTLTQELQEAGISVTRLHSSRSQEQRTQALQDFKDGKIRVLVATDIVARGIDVFGITHVVNYDFPVNPEDYIHRIGRTGRAEASGTAISFVPEKDQNLLGILEFHIARRLTRKKIKGFNYQEPRPRPTPGARPPKQDWRKRTRERDAKRELKLAIAAGNESKKSLKTAKPFAQAGKKKLHLAKPTTPSAASPAPASKPARAPKKTNDHGREATSKESAKVQSKKTSASTPSLNATPAKPKRPGKKKSNPNKGAPKRLRQPKNDTPTS